MLSGNRGKRTLSTWMDSIRSSLPVSARLDQSFATTYAASTPYGQGHLQQQQRVPALPTNPGDTNLSTALLDPIPLGFGGSQYGTSTIGGGQAEVKYSSRHNGFYGYFARVMG